MGMYPNICPHGIPKCNCKSCKNKSHEKTVKNLTNQIKHMDRDQVYRYFRIEIHKDGTIYDSQRAREFKSINDWAEYRLGCGRPSPKCNPRFNFAPP